VALVKTLKSYRCSQKEVFGQHFDGWKEVAEFLKYQSRRNPQCLAKNRISLPSAANALSSWLLVRTLSTINSVDLKRFFVRVGF